MPHKAFEPAELGPITLSNHIVMSPLTRSRAVGNIPNDLMVEYYRQRATAGLIVTEGTSPSPNGLGYSSIPGLFNRQHAEAWKKVTDAVHAKGGHIFVQLMHSGSIFHDLNLPEGAEGVAPSAVQAAGQMYTIQKQLQPHGIPRAISTDELPRIVQEYVESAKLAIEAGFDGVELHGANGYLLEQFLNPVSNQRADTYGGSVRNRARFVLETAKAVADAIGAEHTGIRLSPWGMASDMPHYPEIDETYQYLAEELQKIGLVYVHLVNHGPIGGSPLPAATLDIIRRNFTNKLIQSGGFSTVDAIDAALADKADLVAVGRPFISNPDLVARLKNGIPLAAPDPSTFYTPGAHGYTDYPPAS